MTMVVVNRYGELFVLSILLAQHNLFATKRWNLY